MYPSQGLDQYNLYQRLSSIQSSKGQSIFRMTPFWSACSLHQVYHSIPLLNPKHFGLPFFRYIKIFNAFLKTPQISPRNTLIIYPINFIGSFESQACSNEPPMQTSYPLSTNHYQNLINTLTLNGRTFYSVLTFLHFMVTNVIYCYIIVT